MLATPINEALFNLYFEMPTYLGPVSIEQKQHRAQSRACGGRLRLFFNGGATITTDARVIAAQVAVSKICVAEACRR